VAAVGEFDPSQFFGFVYLIEQKSSGRAYIGKKQLKFKRQRTKFDSSRTKESDWRDYTSSSDIVNDLITEAGKDDFEFRILKLCTGRCALTYSEQEMQFAQDVLRARLPNGEKKFFNRTIGYKNFAGVEKQTEEAKLKISLGNTGKVRTPEARERYSQSKKGIPKTLIHREHLAIANRGKVQSSEVRTKIALANTQLYWWNNGQTNRRVSQCPGVGWKAGRCVSTTKDPARTDAPSPVADQIG
jgi:hypothetical protein